MALPVGFVFGEVRAGRGGFGLVRERSEIERSEGTLRLLPSVAVFRDRTADVDEDEDEDEGGGGGDGEAGVVGGKEGEGEGQGEMVAWGFLGVDGSLTSLYVEEGYRGLGLAKAVTGRLLREKTVGGGWFEGVRDGFGHAIVAGENGASLGVCGRLGARFGWDVYWVRVDLGRVGQ